MSPDQVPDLGRVIDVRPRGTAGELAEQRAVWMWCPGCTDSHQVLLDGPGAWGWDGNADRPTFTPSILVRGGAGGRVCHSFVTDGSWHFLEDSTHALAGQVVPMVPLPSWLRLAVQ